ncbi:hypothetical protein AAE02nite_21710 [Adhaeribacter aerolatus]|uniref:histidine kinase n=2 Tax=Adhaeribacter aerolatus TaxID=670289 RepID=A0A512AYB4_9BACT|nr:hypothetical protein AAE02nite_21710 [Adhaeribacter aerolatus]
MQPSLGWQSAEVIGEDIRSYIHEEDIAFFEMALAAAYSRGTTETFTYRVRACNGQWRWLTSELINLLTLQAVQGFILRSRDVTENVEAAAKIKEKEAYYESLFHNNPDSVSLLNSEGIIEDANESTCQIFGYTKAEIINRHFASFILPESVVAATQAFEKAWAGIPSWIRGKAKHKNGTQLELSLTIIPIIHQSKVIKVQEISQDITQIIRAHKLIKDQAEAQSSIFESVNEGFLTLDKNYYITYINQVCAAFLTQRKEAVLNKPLFRIYPNLVSSLFFRKCKEVEQTGKPVHFQEYFPLTKVTLDFDIYPTKKGFAVHFLDVSEKIAQQENFEKLFFVASKVSNGVLILQADFAIEWANESFLKVLDISLPEVKGKRVSEILGENNVNLATIFEIGQKMQSGIAFSEDISFTKKNEQQIWLHVDITPAVDESGKIKGYFLILSDVSELKEAELSLQRQARDLFIKNQDFQQFTYIISHNLRAPVANALGYTDLLTKVDKNEPVYDELVDKLRTSVTRLDEVIKDINTILTFRDRDKPAEKQLVSVAGVYLQARESLQEALTECGALVVEELDENCMLYANKGYLYSIIYNLISNAISYRAISRQLHLLIKVIKTRNGEIVLRISDNGSGMDLDKVKGQLFKLYKRFNTKVEGKGMGLFLVKYQVEALNGTIVVESQVDEGTIFTITFRADDSQSISN